MKLKLTRTIKVAACAGVLLILLDLIALHATGLWMVGIFVVAFGVFRSHMRQLDAEREELEQKEFEQELLLQKKRRAQTGEVDLQKEKLRRQLETEREQEKLRWKNS